MILWSILFVTGLSSSCSDSYFDKYPSDSMQMETYLTNDSEVKNVLLDSYYSLRVISENAIYINDICTDVAYFRKKNNATDFIALNESTWDATLSLSDSIWVQSYKMINRCNNV
ncbi:MAG: RagB/SusD family nutrient uptake outer membrane protein, partial [Parabacteroides sp.]